MMWNSIKELRLYKIIRRLLNLKEKKKSLISTEKEGDVIDYLLRWDRGQNVRSS